MVIGRRLGFGTEDMRPHNVTYTTLGAAMLWVGWFGFNAGSALSASALAANAMVVTHLSAAAGAVAWAAMEWMFRESRVSWGPPRVPSRDSSASPPLPASFNRCQPSLWGLRAASSVITPAVRSSRAFGYDDSLDAFGVHGVGGRWEPSHRHLRHHASQPQRCRWAMVRCRPGMPS